MKEVIKDQKLEKEDCFPFLSTACANIGLKKAIRKSGIEDYKMFSCHNIRKSLETWLVGLNLSTLKVLSHFGHNQSTCLIHYVNADILNNEEKSKIRKIIGNLYYCNGDLDFLYEQIKQLGEKIECLQKSQPL